MIVPFSKFYGKVWLLILENAFSQRFHFKANGKSIGSSKKQYQGFSKESSVCNTGMFLCDNQQKFWTFLYFKFEKDFLEKENLFSRHWSTVFQLKALRLKTYHFHTKLPYQKPILRQITQPANIGSQDVPRDVSK